MIKRFLRLFLGLFLYALGIVLTMKANIGYAPWEVFHAGIGNAIGMTIGNVSIVAGIIIGLMAIFLGEKLGLGTLFNMVLIGVFIDFIMALEWIPVMTIGLMQTVLLLVGLFTIALATYFYIGSAFGAGPRDSMMVALARKTKCPIGVCRGTIEVTVVAIGWALGGMVGVGTVISALAIGFFVQLIFKGLNFDVTVIQHETIDETVKKVFAKV